MAKPSNKKSKGKAQRQTTPKKNPPLSRLDSHRALFERILFGLALAGVLVTVHLNIQQGRGFDRGCLGFSTSEAVEATFDCEAVTSSSASQIFGVSNAVWGLLFYLAVAAVCAGIALLPSVRRPLLKRARLGLVGFGFLYSLYLSFTQYFVLKELCALCLISAVIATLLFAVQAVYLLQPPQRERRDAPAPSYALYGGLAVAVLLLAGADVGYFSSLEKTTPPPSATPIAETPAVDPNFDYARSCQYDAEKPYYENFNLLVNDRDAARGAPDAPVTLVEFFDPNCPHCKTLHPIMNTVAAQYGDRVRFVYKPVVVMGTHSVPQIGALYLAAEEGRFFEMLELQFANQDARRGLGARTLRDYAERIGMDGDAFRQGLADGALTNRIRRETQTFGDLGMSGVPTLVLNGRVIASRSRTVPCLGYMIDQELAEDGLADEETPAEASAPGG